MSGRLGLDVHSITNLLHKRRCHIRTGSAIPITQSIFLALFLLLLERTSLWVLVNTISMTVLCTIGSTLIIFTIISTALDERENTSYEQKNVDDLQIQW